MSKIHASVEEIRKDNENGKSRNGEILQWVPWVITFSKDIPAGTTLYCRQNDNNGDVAIVQVAKSLGAKATLLDGKQSAAEQRAKEAEEKAAQAVKEIEELKAQLARLQQPSGQRNGKPAVSPSKP